MFRTTLLVLLFGFSAAASARGYADVQTFPVQQTLGAATDDGAPVLADRLDMLLAMRFQMIEGMQEDVDIDGRRAALQGLNVFATTTIEGLIAAAPAGEMQMLMAARLRPVLERHQEKIAAALTALDAARVPAQAAVEPGRVSSGRGAPTFHE